MRQSLKTGVNFGITSGVITTLGLIVGLQTSTNSKLAVIAGIISIAIVDSFSDALGIHISQESQHKSEKSIWESTFSTIASKFIIAISFIIPFLLFKEIAIMIATIYGYIILIVSSYKIAQSTKEKPFEVITEHIYLATFVLILTYFAGTIIGKIF